jgi:hypothetical protein
VEIHEDSCVYYCQLKTTTSRTVPKEKQQCWLGRTKEHDETVLVRRLPLVPGHLLVRGTHRTAAAVGAVHAGARLAEVTFPATEAQAAAETSWGRWTHTERKIQDGTDTSHFKSDEM